MGPGKQGNLQMIGYAMTDWLMFPETAATAAPAPRASPWVRQWLWLVAALVFAMVVVGGATRLTESGLSITEWKTRDRHPSADA